MNERIKVIQLMSKTELVELTTADGKYHVRGNITRNPNVVTSVNDAQVIRDDGQQMATIMSWSRHGQISVNYTSGIGNIEVQEAIEEFLTAIQDAGTAQEGGMA